MYKYVYFWKIKNSVSDYKPTVLVTGCSSGIGLALAKLLYKLDRFRVIISAREPSLDIVKKEFSEHENFWILPLDVTDDTSRIQLIERVKARWGRVDILINNAGVCYRSVLEEMQNKDEYIQMNTNYLGPIALVRLVLPEMRKSGRGKIINVSSVSGMMAMPTMASYSASKYALEGSMEALWYELRPFGINVSLVQPGFVRSGSYQKVKYTEQSQLSNTTDRPYSSIYKEMTPFIERFMKFGLVTPEDIANLILLVMKTENPPLWIPASFDAEFFYYLKRLFPRRLLMPFFYAMLPGSSTWASAYTRRRRQSFIVRMGRTILRKLGINK